MEKLTGESSDPPEKLETIGSIANPNRRACRPSARSIVCIVVWSWAPL